MEPVLFEMKVVLDQRRACIGVISNAVAMNDRIDQGKREKEQNEKDARIAGAGRNTLVGRQTRGTTPR